MNRRQRRVAKSDVKPKTYVFKEDDLQRYIETFVEDELKRVKKEATEEALNTAMILLLVLPMEVLMDHYWKKTYSKKIPEFTEHILDYYERWEKGELDMEKMQKDLWEYGGVRLEVKDDNV